MRAIVRTMIIRDREGYEVRDYGEPQPATSGATILGAPPSGIHIVGCSGVNNKVWITTEQNNRLWEKARRLDSPDSVARFMCRWGQISRWLTDDGSRRYEESFSVVEEHLQGLRHLATYVETNDELGFAWTLNNHLLLSRSDIAIDVQNSQITACYSSSLIAALYDPGNVE